MSTISITFFLSRSPRVAGNEPPPNADTLRKRMLVGARPSARACATELELDAGGGEMWLRFSPLLHVVREWTREERRRLETAVT